MTDRCVVLAVVVAATVVQLAVLVTLHARTTAQLEGFESGVGARLDALETDLLTRLDDFEASVLARLDAFETSVGAALETATSVRGSFDLLDGRLARRSLSLHRQPRQRHDRLESHGPVARVLDADVDVASLAQRLVVVDVPVDVHDSFRLRLDEERRPRRREPGSLHASPP